MSWSKKIATFIKKIPLVLKVYLLIAVLAPLLANERPLVLKYHGEWHFPAFSTSNYFKIYNEDGTSESELSEFVNWSDLNADFSIYAPIRWTAGKTDLANANFASPFGEQYKFDKVGRKIALPILQRHFLGTTRSGEDVCTGLIYGSRISMIIGCLFVLIAGVIGVILGGLAGYFGDHRFKLGWLSVLLTLFLIFPASYVSRIFIMSGPEITIGSVLSYTTAFIIFILILCIPILLEKRIGLFKTKEVSIPIDFIVSRFTEIFLSLPRVILILTLAAISKPSLLMLVLIIGLTSWTDIARITRAEVMKLRDIEFIQVERAMGAKFNRILLLHLAPNILPALQNVFVYGFASAIMTETGLSFLGIGLPPGTPSWGSLMFSARENFTAWWLVILPGLTITLLLISLNNYAAKLLKKRRKNSQFVNIF
jgi:peptide/nickel transport system permease protein